MFYFPGREAEAMFNNKASVLPPKLIEKLVSNGLGVCVLPPSNKEKSKSILRDKFFIKNELLENDGRVTVDTPFYSPVHKLIVIPYANLFSKFGECCVIHELAHAVDFLYLSSTGYNCLSSYNNVIRALNPKKPLNEYCRVKYVQSGLLLEQFACSFAAYYREEEYSGSFNTVYDLSKKFILFMNNYITEPYGE